MIRVFFFFRILFKYCTYCSLSALHSSIPQECIAAKVYPMDQIDHVANRMSLAALSGLVVGASLATYKGSNIIKTAISVSSSFALCGTACFGSERIAYNVLNLYLTPDNEHIQYYRLSEHKNKLLLSHSLGGAVGGMICGGLFQGRLMAGIFLFTPIMLGVAFTEITFLEYREKRLQEIVEETMDSNN